jgi:hypothetical protein
MNYKNDKFGKIKLSCRLGDDLLLPVEPVFCQSASKFDPPYWSAPLMVDRQNCMPNDTQMGCARKFILRGRDDSLEWRPPHRAAFVQGAMRTLSAGSPSEHSRGHPKTRRPVARTAAACACSASGWSAAASSGHRQLMAQWRSRQRNSAICCVAELS